MLNQVVTAKQRWGGSNRTIDNWLSERQQLLIAYCELAGVNYQHDETLPDTTAIGEFCSLLMDYLSAGHFEVYELLTGDDDQGQQLKTQLDPLIAVTTDQALDFNDSYADNFNADDAAEFEASTAALGQSLAERFDLEDKLIQHMHKLTHRLAVQ